MAELKDTAANLSLAGERVVEGEGEPVPVVQDPTTLDEVCVVVGVVAYLSCQGPLDSGELCLQVIDSHSHSHSTSAGVLPRWPRVRRHPHAQPGPPLRTSGSQV